MFAVYTHIFKVYSYYVNLVRKTRGNSDDDLIKIKKKMAKYLRSNKRKMWETTAAQPGVLSFLNPFFFQNEIIY